MKNKLEDEVNVSFREMITGGREIIKEKLDNIKAKICGGTYTNLIHTFTVTSTVGFITGIASTYMISHYLGIFGYLDSNAYKNSENESKLDGFLKSLEYYDPENHEAVFGLACLLGIVGGIYSQIKLYSDIIPEAFPMVMLGTNAVSLIHGTGKIMAYHIKNQILKRRKDNISKL